MCDIGPEHGPLLLVKNEGHTHTLTQTEERETVPKQKMFYGISLEHEMLLHPRYFCPNLLNIVKQKLFTEVEGTSTGKYGFVNAVTMIDNISAGVIQPGRGFVLRTQSDTSLVNQPSPDLKLHSRNAISVLEEAGDPKTGLLRFSSTAQLCCCSLCCSLSE